MEIKADKDILFFYENTFESEVLTQPQRGRLMK